MANNARPPKPAEQPPLDGPGSLGVDLLPACTTPISIAYTLPSVASNLSSIGVSSAIVSGATMFTVTSDEVAPLSFDPLQSDADAYTDDDAYDAGVISLMKLSLM